MIFTLLNTFCATSYNVLQKCNTYNMVLQFLVIYLINHIILLQFENNTNTCYIYVTHNVTFVLHNTITLPTQSCNLWTYSSLIKVNRDLIRGMCDYLLEKRKRKNERTNERENANYFKALSRTIFFWIIYTFISDNCWIVRIVTTYNLLIDSQILVVENYFIEINKYKYFI